MKGNSLHNACLAYNGHAIRDRGKTVSLTDMWKAAGSPENREPWNWSRKEGAEFVEFVAASHNLTMEQVMITKKGKGGGTWAHWQLAMAYAKYLSPEFHAWCNSVVRAHMEGRTHQALLADRQNEALLKIRITACNAVTRLLGEARRNGGAQYAAHIMPAAFEMLGIRVPDSVIPAPLRQGNLFDALPSWSGHRPN
ncbi:KilA-N domain-containing protein [Azospirillum soli]|uniref:KilA-N domain-containing protein n=1 Tax=Azospirillum soli TaxID=1304799 RepID=UPI001AEBA095|nr:KilA-N domain-containing protein [Azospirillum soli]MBP2312615.1 hypothetical protein [Azospirillum soli]